MKVKVLSLNEDTIRFLLEDVDVAFANALRRAMVSEVPVMAIDDVFIFDNSSLVPDEVLAHRVGLVPLTTDLETYVLPEDCDCQADLGCPKCRVALTMDVDAGDENRTVYSGDLVPEDPEVKPVSPHIPLAKLVPGQSIRFEAYAQLGQGKVHAKWSPVSMAVYQNVAEIDAGSAAKAKECAEACPEGVIAVGGRKLKVVDHQAFYRCETCRGLYPHENLRDAIKQDEFMFTVESNGALPPVRLVSEAVKLLKGKLDELEGKIERGETDDEILEFETHADVRRSLFTFGSSDLVEGDEEGGEGKDDDKQ